MKVTGCEYTKYELKLKRPFQSSRERISERKGFIVKLYSGALEAQGDVSPFAELGSENLLASENMLKKIKDSFSHYGLIFNEVSDIEKALKKISFSFPAVRHGIEQALLSLLAKEKEATLPTLLKKVAAQKVFVNSVIGLCKAKDIQSEVEKCINAGYETIKLKVGREDFADEIECIKLARTTAGDKAKIRIDVNCKWELKEAIKKLEQLEPYNIEYAEQPVRSKEDMIELSKNSNIPIAADESIKTVNDASEFIEKCACPVLILKPMILGGILNTIKIIEEAQKNNTKIIVSSSFESHLGWRSALFLASILKDNNAHGLGTIEYFSDDEGRLPITNGKIVIDSPNYFTS
ncbi:MAG: o-succinylbenzoate synthase [Clostridiales bacterium]